MTLVPTSRTPDRPESIKVVFEVADFRKGGPRMKEFGGPTALASRSPAALNFRLTVFVLVNIWDFVLENASCNNDY